MGTRERQLVSGALRLPENAGGEGTAAPRVEPRQRGQDEAGAGHGDHRLRHALLRVDAEEALRPPAGYGGQLREEPGADRDRRVPEWHAPGRLLHAGRARGRPRRRRDVGLRQCEGRRRVLPRRPREVEFPLQPRPRRFSPGASAAAAPGLRRGLHAAMTELEKTVAKHLGPRYTQHNPNAADGPEGLTAFLGFLKEKFPNSRSEIKRVFTDGDYVILHVHAMREPGTRGNAIVDIFRLEDGKIVEHWDVV